MEDKNTYFTIENQKDLEYQGSLSQKIDDLIKIRTSQRGRLNKKIFLFSSLSFSSYQEQVPIPKYFPPEKVFNCRDQYLLDDKSLFFSKNHLNLIAKYINPVHHNQIRYRR